MSDSPQSNRSRLFAETFIRNARAATGPDRRYYIDRARQYLAELVEDPQSLELLLAWMRRVGAPAALVKHVSVLLGKGKTARAILALVQWVLDPLTVGPIEQCGREAARRPTRPTRIQADPRQARAPGGTSAPGAAVALIRAPQCSTRRIAV